MADAAAGTCTVDMRSDTVTHPTPEMRAAMASAKVGDDVMGEDPTVNELEDVSAKRFGKEAALFVPTGTMGNLIAFLTHCEARGSEAIVGSQSHVHIWEQGGMATLGGIHPFVVPNEPDGTMRLEDIEAAIRTSNVHFPITKVVALEQTHNMCGGKVLPLSYIDSVAALCKKRDLKLHIDGARILNACAASGVSPDRMVRDADSVSVCLSKGLASPVGSVLVGTKDFIAKARHARKALGGGMRQAGVLAACGLLSLERMALPTRLEEDHRRAKNLAAALAGIEGLSASAEETHSNIVFITVTAPGLAVADLVANLRKRGTLVLSPKPSKIRAAMHYQVDDAGVEKAIADFTAAMAELAPAAAACEGEPAAKRQRC